MPRIKVLSPIFQVATGDFNLHVQSFEEWKKANPEVTGDNCPDCLGEGSHECIDCGDLHRCGTCDGKGHPGDMSLQDIYIRQVKKEARMLSHWLGNAIVDVIIVEEK